MHLLLGTIISGILVFFLAYQVDYAGLLSALQATHYPALIPAVLLLLFTLLIRAWRWHYLLAPIKTIGPLPLLSVTSIGFMANMVLPARTGEVIRAYMIGQKEQISKMTSFATIVVERVLDLISILVIGGVVLMAAGIPAESSITEGVKVGGYFSALLCGVAIGGLLLLRSRTTQVIGLMKTGLAFLPQPWLDRLSELLLSFALGLQSIRKGQHLLLIFSLSLGLWLGGALSNFFILRAFHLHLPFYVPFFLLVVQMLGVTIPSSPGFIGTYHAAVVAGLHVFGVSQELALSIAIIMHATFFFPFILTGLFFLWKENLSFRELWSAKMHDAS